MSWIRRTVGLDGVDIVIQAGVTMFLMIMAGSRGGPADEVAVAAVGALSMVVLGVRRHFALKRGPQRTVGEITGEVIGDRLAELEARMADMEQAHYRVQELEERLDFAERLLAQAREPERLA